MGKLDLFFSILLIICLVGMTFSSIMLWETINTPYEDYIKLDIHQEIRCFENRKEINCSEMSEEIEQFKNMLGWENKTNVNTD